MSRYDILKKPNFRLLVLGRFFLTLAFQLQAVVLGWQVYEIKKDALYLGFIGLAEAIPALSLALFGGHTVDRGQPLLIYRWMVSLAAVSAVVLLGTAGGLLGVSPEQKIFFIFGVTFVSGVIRAFAWPAIFSLTPKLVDREELPLAQTWMSATFQTAAISGPAIGGMLYAWGGPAATYSTILAMMIIGLTCACLMRIDRFERRDTSKETLADSLTTGLKFVFANQVILGALALDMFAVLFGGATALLPIFASEILMSGPQSLGILRASPAVGALLMNFVMIHRPLGRSAGKVLFFAVAGFGLCMIGFGLSRTLWISLIFLAVSGALDAISVIVRHTTLQLATPDEMRGRVSAVNMIFIGSSNEIGEFESGLAARLLGTVPSVVFGGCMTLLVVGVTAVFAPKLRKMEFETAISKKS